MSRLPNIPIYISVSKLVQFKSKMHAQQRNSLGQGCGHLCPAALPGQARSAPRWVTPWTSDFADLCTRLYSADFASINDQASPRYGTILANSAMSIPCESIWVHAIYHIALLISHVIFQPTLRRCSASPATMKSTRGSASPFRFWAAIMRWGMSEVTADDLGTLKIGLRFSERSLSAWLVPWANLFPCLFK